jgi:hypothetical protein
MFARLARSESLLPILRSQFPSIAEGGECRARRPEGEKGLAKAVNVKEQNLDQTWRCVGLPLASCLLPLASSCAVPLRLRQP